MLTNAGSVEALIQTQKYRFFVQSMIILSRDPVPLNKMNQIYLIFFLQ